MATTVIIGAGITGLSAAWALRDDPDLLLIEKGSRLGGHADTVTLRDVPVDMGFIVYNEPHYPNLTRLFEACEVETVESDMSFALGGDFEYGGSLNGLLGGTNFFRPRAWGLASDILKFPRLARESLDSELPIGQWVESVGLSTRFRDDYLMPMASAIWSSSGLVAEEIPALTLLRFFDSHALLDLRGRPTWRTVKNGSERYVKAVSERIKGGISVGDPAVAVSRSNRKVTVELASGTRVDADQVIFATHADVTLRLLGTDATEEERRVLESFTYSDNEAVFHSDPRLMPRTPRVWSSWNVMRDKDAPNSPVCITYWMNRLQPWVKDPAFVTLNPLVPPDEVHVTRQYRHPVFGAQSVAAQKQLASIQGANQAWFGGAWAGYGFHEDGAEAGLRLGAAAGGDVPWLASVDSTRPTAQIVESRE